MIIISNFLFNFCVIVSFLFVSFLTKLLKLGILFSTAIRAVIAAKTVIWGISPLMPFISVLREALVAKLLIPGILSSMYIILALYTSFLRTSFFYYIA